LALCAALGGAVPARGSAQDARVPRYAEAIERELTAMGLAPECVSSSATRFACDYRARSSETERDLPARAAYSDESDTVYFYVEQFLLAPATAPATGALLRRLMELNWTLLVGKFEWNPESGEVRLGAVLHTDSNFDRRAFRSIVLALDTTAARYRAELHALQDSTPVR
jgi:hypothetical protein